MRARVRAVGIAVVAGVSSLGGTSSAHIDLLSPAPRMGGRGNTYLDAPPCGQRDAGRSSQAVSVFRPGETISVSWDAYVQHPSYFRLSFDVDGDDSFSERTATPADPARDDPTRLPQGDGELILAYVPDPGGELEHVEQTITLPSAPCEACTLQLTQFIYNVPLDEATYYQCADVVLEGEPVPAAAPEPSEAAGDSAPSGCAVRAPSRSSAFSVLSVLVAGLAYRRRRRTRCRATR